MRGARSARPADTHDLKAPDMTFSRSLLAATAGLALLSGSAFAQPASPPMRVRGTIEKVDGNTLTIKPRAGADITVKLTDNAGVVGVKEAKPGDIKPGAYIGTASVPGKDGDEAMEVTVFPASMNGTGEGSFPWDLGSNSTMTNGTVVAADGRTMTVKYGANEKKITVPADVPIVLLSPGADKSLIKAGAGVVVQPTKAADGTLTANRITVGENGVVPPM